MNKGQRKYRRANGLKATGRLSVFIHHATNTRAQVGDERTKQRLDDLAKCEKVGGVTICPPRAAFGYGQDNLMRALGR